MVLRRGLASLPALHSIFTEFATISGLHISIGKTVLVPLHPFDLLALRAELSRIVPDWGALAVLATAKYLGFFVGPGKHEKSWGSPLDKYAARATLWGALGLGLHMTLRAYRIYAASVLLFVAQLEDLPSTFDHAEATACRRLFPGPHLWITPGVLKELRALEFPTDLARIHTIAVAAKSRVVRYENVAQGGLQIQ